MIDYSNKPVIIASDGLPVKFKLPRTRKDLAAFIREREEKAAYAREKYVKADMETRFRARLAEASGEEMRTKRDSIKALSNLAESMAQVAKALSIAVEPRQV